MKENNSELSYQFLRESAIRSGADDAVLIPVSAIITEERIQLKCRTGCPSYGRCLSCPPYAPDIGLFRRMLGEYKFALLVRFRSKVIVEPEIIHSLMKNRNEPTVSPEIKEKTATFDDAFGAESRWIHSMMLALEKEAFDAGNPFALAFTVDSCEFCKICNVKGGVCMRPEKMRYSLEAVGINVIETAGNAGILIEFPCPVPPNRIGLLLIA